MHLCLNLLKDGFQILGIDNLNDYYSLKLKRSRLQVLSDYSNFKFEKADISDEKKVLETFKNFSPHKVVNLAAQAGVRYSLKNPKAYIMSNICGFLNILEACRIFNVKSLIYASSSSVYGLNENMPFDINDVVNKPISVYATSKISNELLAYNYNHLYGLNATGLRYFTVYGPWGRPDMAIYIFTKKINEGKPIDVFNNGNMMRDFTYVDDIIEGTKSAILKSYDYEIFNLGNNRAENILNVISYIEFYLKKKAKINFCQIQAGDVEKTFANIDYSSKMLDYVPHTNIDKGIKYFVNWFKSYYS